MDFAVYLALGLGAIFVIAFAGNIIAFLTDLSIFSYRQRRYNKWASPNRPSRRQEYFETSKKEPKEVLQKDKIEEKIYIK